MISATHRHEAVNPLLAAASSLTTSKSVTDSSSSFAQQFNSALKGEAGKGTPDSQQRVKAIEESGQKTGESQFLVTSKVMGTKTVTPITAGPETTASSSTASTTASTTSSIGGTPISDIPTMLGMGPTPGTAPVQQQATTAQALTTSSTPTESEADAYWNAQPVAVQALRNMPDGEAKNQLALQLANSGYSIDTQIMVWGWDPQMTMTVRENQGYSWVPGYGQSNIPVGPGLSMPGTSTSYNPGNAPSGGIEVSTAFAVGTVQNPLVSSTNT